MKIKKIIFVRHGDYVDVEPFNLSDDGKSSVRRLAFKLIPEIEGKEVVCVTSIANRASQTAEEMEAVWFQNDIDVSFTRHYELWSGSDAYQEVIRLEEEDNQKVSVYDKAWLYKFIQSSDKEVVVVVSHLEIVENSSSLFGFRSRELSKGHARVLNLETKEETII